MWKQLLISVLLAGLCALTVTGGENCRQWPKWLQAYSANNRQFTCNGSITQYMICMHGEADDGFKLRVSLSMRTPNSSAFGNYYVHDSNITKPEINKFCNISTNKVENAQFQPGNMLGALIKQTEDTSVRKRIQDCNIPLLVTTNSNYTCTNESGHLYIIQKVTEDCFETITSRCSTSTGNISNHTESKSWPSQTSPSDLVSAPPNGTIAVITILLVLLLIETITCGALWVMCLKCPRLYNKVRKAQTLTRHTTDPHTPVVESQSSVYHNLEGPSQVYYEAVQNSGNDTRRPTGASHSTAKYNSHYELEHSRETAFNESVELNIHYWNPVGTANDIYSQITSKKYTIIQPSGIQLTAMIGEGEFGEVYKGEWTTDNNIVQMAAKVLKESASEEDRAKLLKEAAIMGQFNHKHVVKLFGVANDGKQVLLVMEFLPGGDLNQCLLRQCQSETFLPKSQLAKQLLKFCTQITDAMAYLSGRGFIHRDLAARNILLDEHMQCKIADFGMSHDLEEDYYYKPKGGRIPVKWTAPEAILYRKYSTKSDVWSYGMVMYEIWSLGHKPFEDFAIEEVLRVLDKGYCQPSPPSCPRGIYHIMVECWHPDAHQRPTFKDIYEKLQRNASTLLRWEEKDNTGPEAATLGAPLQYGATLHQDLQQKYR